MDQARGAAVSDLQIGIGLLVTLLSFALALGVARFMRRGGG